MSADLFDDLLRQLCTVVGLPDPQQMVAKRQMQVEGFDVLFDYLEDDPEAFYLYFHPLAFPETHIPSLFVYTVPTH